jgi:hypothetical protein
MLSSHTAPTTGLSALLKLVVFGRDTQFFSNEELVFVQDPVVPEAHSSSKESTETKITTQTKLVDKSVPVAKPNRVGVKTRLYNLGTKFGKKFSKKSK